MMIPGFIQRGVEAALEPVVSRLIAAGVRPNAITTVGTAVLIAGGVAFGAGWVRLGGTLLLLSGVFDMLDGRVARGGGRTTKFGAFYDSTLDRVGESALFLGITLYFASGDAVPAEWRTAAVAVSVIALAGGLMVSYARARAEGLGLECKVGIAQRAERILLLGAPTLLFGAGPRGFLLLGVVAVLALVALLTVVQRIRHVYRATATAPRRTTQARWVEPALASSSRKGRGGD